MSIFLLPPRLVSSNSSSHLAVDECFRATLSLVVFTASFITNLLLLPLFVLVLGLGFRRWRRHRSSLTHSDLFLHHSTLMCVNSFLGFTVFFWGGFLHHGVVMWAGLYIWTVSSSGQAVLHVLMCVERYLAVLRPLSYLELKRAAGTRIRDVSIACVWLLCVSWAAVVSLSGQQVHFILDYIITAVHILVISFCSLSVLIVLKRPGPGGPGGNRSRQRVFNTILVVLGALALRFTWNLISSVTTSSGALNPREMCVILMSDIWFELPSNLVLPLVFLQQRHRLPCCPQTEVRTRAGPREPREHGAPN